MFDQRFRNRVKILIGYYANRNTRLNRSRNDSGVYSTSSTQSPYRIKEKKQLLGPETSMLCTVKEGSRHRDESEEAGL